MRGWLMLGAAGIVVALAACGGPGHVPGPSACALTDLQVRLDIHAAGVAAGTAFLPIDFTNVSGAQCDLAGFPVVTAATGRTGRAVGANAATDRSLAATAVVLKASGTAHIWLRLADVLNIPASQCRPAAAPGLRVRLPGQADSLFIRHPVMTCTKPVRGLDVLTVEPFRPGQAERGTAH
jgi:hypothetical protein